MGSGSTRGTIRYVAGNAVCGDDDADGEVGLSIRWTSVMTPSAVHSAAQVKTATAIHRHRRGTTPQPGSCAAYTARTGARTSTRIAQIGKAMSARITSAAGTTSATSDGRAPVV